MSLSVGDKVPSFDSTDQNGNSFNLDKFKDQKIVLYFYPRDNTSGCTAQACDLRDNFQEFKNNNYVIVGVSTDSPKSHVKFIEKNNNTINENLCFVPFFKKADLIAIMKSSLLVSILS